MIKECPVILNNTAVTVVKFDNIEIQFPSIHKNAEKVFVKYDNGKYAIVENFEENTMGSYKKRFQKKTAVEEEVEHVSDEIGTDAE